MNEPEHYKVDYSAEDITAYIERAKGLIDQGRYIVRR